MRTTETASQPSVYRVNSDFAMHVMGEDTGQSWTTCRSCSDPLTVEFASTHDGDCPICDAQRATGVEWIVCDDCCLHHPATYVKDGSCVGCSQRRADDEARDAAESDRDNAACDLESAESELAELLAQVAESRRAVATAKRRLQSAETKLAKLND